MKTCVYSSSLSVLINGSPTKQVDINKGLKQGDPLTPFLFLSVVERVGVLMKRVVELGLFQKVPN
jgi:hypothetical protein